jgi:tRNA(fMet)-specific endonuclease VapC
VAVILDTNALSAFVDGNNKILKIIGRQPELALPVIVLGEYLYGIRQSRLRIRYEEWLRTNLDLFDLLSVGRSTANFYAEIRREQKNAGKPIPSNDIWIAALAREHRFPIVTRDAHFQSVDGLRVLAW